MFISVALCTYNGDKYLQEQLDSLVNQTHRPDELVIGDDGSTDNTISLIEKFSKTSPFPVTLIKNDITLGFRDNFLQTALKCRGRYIAFCDQDDVWLPEKLKICLDVLENEGHLLTSHAFDSVDADLKFIAHFGPAEDTSYSCGKFAKRHTLGFTQAFRRDLLMAFDVGNRPKDPNKFSAPLAHDQWIPFLADSLGSTHLIAQTLALYRQHGNNLYGMQAKPSIFRKISCMMNFYGSSGYKYRSTLSEIYLSQSQILVSSVKLAEYFSDTQINNAHLSSTYWKKCARIEALRASVFNSRSIQSRAVAWLHAITGGAYGQAGLKGMLAMVKDLLGGVLFPSRESDYLIDQLPLESP